MRLPLAGVLVVGLEQAVAAPLATRHLADLGARVIKVEPPDGGDFTRAYDGALAGLGAHFFWLNRGKESITVDITTPEGADVLERLIARADVVVQNLAPGSAARRGLDATQLCARHPALIGVDISGYGEGGPYEGKRAYDLLVQAESGSCSVTGFVGRPAKPGIPIADVGAGMYAYASVLAALYDRKRGGRGVALSVSLFDAISEWMGYPLYYTLGTGVELAPNGMSSPSVAPYGAFRTSDNQVIVIGTTNDREWQRLARSVLGRNDLADDASLSSNAARVEQRGRVDEAIASWASGLVLGDAAAALDAAAIGNARLNGVQGLVDHPQHAGRARWATVDTPVGPLAALRPPAVASTWEQRMEAVPGLGEHTEAILGELGLDAAAIGGLRARAVV